jgi:hypothetical protein
MYYLLLLRFKYYLEYLHKFVNNLKIKLVDISIISFFNKINYFQFMLITNYRYSIYISFY